MRSYHILFAFLVGLLVGVNALATPFPEETSGSQHASYILSSDVGTSPLGKYLGFHFGPVLQLTERLKLEVALGIESDLGQAYKFRPALTAQLDYYWNERLNVLVALHSTTDVDHLDLGLLAGVELLFYSTQVDTLGLAAFGGMSIDGRGMAMVAARWSIRPRPN